MIGGRSYLNNFIFQTCSFWLNFSETASHPPGFSALILSECLVCLGLSSLLAARLAKGVRQRVSMGVWGGSQGLRRRPQEASHAECSSLRFTCKGLPWSSASQAAGLFPEPERLGWREQVEGAP